MQGAAKPKDEEVLLTDDGADDRWGAEQAAAGNAWAAVGAVGADAWAAKLRWRSAKSSSAVSASTRPRSPRSNPSWTRLASLPPRLGGLLICTLPKVIFRAVVGNEIEVLKDLHAKGADFNIYGAEGERGFLGRWCSLAACPPVRAFWGQHAAAHCMLHRHASHGPVPGGARR